MPRVLIVDDEPVIANTLRLIFEKHGFTARTCNSTEEALHTAEGFRPELMLCDINMPERDGVELISAMNHAHPDCRILVLTGAYASMERVREQAVSLQRKMPILAKPCQPSDLLREADALLLTA